MLSTENIRKLYKVRQLFAHPDHAYSMFMQAFCECGAGFLRCARGGGCVRSARVCDGQLDCPDRSDEWNCLALVNSTLEIRSV
jgi:hypothetical protein